MVRLPVAWMPPPEPLAAVLPLTVQCSMESVVFVSAKMPPPDRSLLLPITLVFFIVKEQLSPIQMPPPESLLPDSFLSVSVPPMVLSEMVTEDTVLPSFVA